MNPLRSRLAVLLIAIVMASGCAKQPVHDETTTIGPFKSLSGRLIVIEPDRRWQVVIQWHAETPERGEVRLAHAATGTVVEFRWAGPYMQIRDGNASSWRSLTNRELGEHGIVIPPKQLASILLGRMPAHFVRKKGDLWESRKSGHPIRLQWLSSSRKLIMSDIKHGRRATLIIQP